MWLGEMKKKKFLAREAHPKLFSHQYPRAHAKFANTLFRNEFRFIRYPEKQASGSADP